MTYKLDVSGCGPNSRIWINFLSEWNTRAGHMSEISHYRVFNEMLAEHNAYDDIKGSHIIFDTEEDAVIFKLKYSK